MRLNHEATRRLAADHGETLGSLLRRAGVSRTAYYSLARRLNILPRTVRAIAEAAGVSEADLLEESPAVLSAEELRLARAREICSRYPDTDFNNVWHTLTLLERPPLERLRGSLRRGRA